MKKEVDVKKLPKEFVDIIYSFERFINHDMER